MSLITVIGVVFVTTGLVARGIFLGNSNSSTISDSSKGVGVLNIPCPSSMADQTTCEEDYSFDRDWCQCMPDYRCMQKCREGYIQDLTKICGDCILPDGQPNLTI
jgi:hypothetical protein